MPVTIQKKAGRDERLAIRISPQDKKAVEIAAQKTGRTISALAKEALDIYLRAPERGLHVELPGAETSSYLPDLCWDPLQPHRVVKLATYAPELLDRHERTVWTLICEDEKYLTRDKEPNYPKIRDDWLKLNTKAQKLLDSYG